MPLGHSKSSNKQLQLFYINTFFKTHKWLWNPTVTEGFYNMTKYTGDIFFYKGLYSGTIEFTLTS